MDMQIAKIENQNQLPEALTNVTRGFIEASTSDNTRRAYHSDWQLFTGWCEARSLASLPADPSTVAAFLADLASSHKPSTITRILASISVAHKSAGFQSPAASEIVHKTLRGIRRVSATNGVRTNRKDPVCVSRLRQLAHTMPHDIRGIRDKAVLLVGFAGAFRRSELAGLNVADLQFKKDSVIVTVRRSKTDQTGQGMIKTIGKGANIETCGSLSYPGGILYLANT